MEFRLVEITDPNTVYGILNCENKNITKDDLQRKIDEIKMQFLNEKIEEWNTGNIIDRMPEEWKVVLRPDTTETLLV